MIYSIQEHKPQTEKPAYDFEVIRCKEYTRMPSGEMVNNEKRQSLVRPDTQTIIGHCSPSYQLVNHADAVGMLKTAIDRTGFDYSEKTILTKDGARLFYHVKFEGIDTNIEGQSVAPQIILVNSYDGSSQFDLDLGAYRMVCQNGMRVGQTFSRTRLKHTVNLNVETIIKNVELKLNSFTQTLVPFWQALTEFDAMQEEGKAIIEDISRKSSFGEKNTKNVLAHWNSERSPVTGGRNAWGIYNAFTSVITHDIQKQSFDRGHELGRKIMPSFEALVKN